MKRGLKIIHYANQLYGGIGVEKKANLPQQARKGLVVPKRILQDELKGREEVIMTLICGDNQNFLSGTPI